MKVDIKELLTVSFTLFAVIDIVGSVPILISLKEKWEVYGNGEPR